MKREKKNGTTENTECTEGTRKRTGGDIPAHSTNSALPRKRSFPYKILLQNSYIRITFNLLALKLSEPHIPQLLRKSIREQNN